MTALSRRRDRAPAAATSRPPSTGPDRPRQVLDRWSGEFAAGRRHRPRGSACPRSGRAEESGRDSDEECERDDRGRCPRTGGGRRRRRATRSDDDQQPPSRERSTSGPNSNPIRMTGRKSAIRSALTHSPEPVRSKTSTVTRSRPERCPRPSRMWRGRGAESREPGGEGRGGGSPDVTSLLGGGQRLAAARRPPSELARAGRSPSEPLPRCRTSESDLRRRPVRARSGAIMNGSGFAWRPRYG